MQFDELNVNNVHSTKKKLAMVGGKSKVNTFRELQEKISKRVMRWKEKYISKAVKRKNYA